ncbi:sulfite reductase [NADPH] flavoprotein component [Basidiobolus ranarum]|uniref:Sulfite reductase [NADPH] flavoprotein component n=1 Tax=Basidiobolus ranarum TaxID=34480 RepID=A0ABR2W2Q8_9FUNG
MTVIAPINPSSFPVGWRLTDKEVLVLGSDSGAIQRATLALNSGANVTLISSDDLNDSLVGKVQHIQRQFQQEDLDNAALVLASAGEKISALKISNRCRDKRIPVHIANFPQYSDFELLVEENESAVEVADHKVEEELVQEESLFSLAVNSFDFPLSSGILDANAAVSYVAYALSDIAFVYPVVPSGHLGEQAEIWGKEGKLNAFGKTVKTLRMDTRSGAATAVLGASSNGSSTSVLTGSQAILHMIPTMYTLADSRVPVVFHVSTQAFSDNLDAFGDNFDIMTARQTGFALLSSSTAQEAYDFAVIAHVASAVTQTPILHFFDGVRVAHEQSQIEIAQPGELVSFYEGILNNDSSFNSVAEAISEVMSKFGTLFGRKYQPVEYYGAEDATDVIVHVGSASSIIEKTVEHLSKDSKKYGFLSVRLYRPWSVEQILAFLPSSTKNIIILEQTSSVTGINGPLLQDFSATLQQSKELRDQKPRLISGKFGGVTNFTPSTVKAIYEQASLVNIIDFNDEAFTNAPEFDIQGDIKQSIFWDIAAKSTANTATHLAKVFPQSQLYTSYDAYTNGGVAFTELRHSEEPTQFLSYPVQHADYIGIHDDSILDKYNFLSAAKKGTKIVINTALKGEELEKSLPGSFKKDALKVQPELFVLDASKALSELGLDKDLTIVVLQAVYLKLQNHTEIAEVLSQQYVNKAGVEVLFRDIVDKIEQELTVVELPATWAEVEAEEEEITLPYKVNGSLAPDTLEESESKFTDVSNWHSSAWKLMFQEAFQTQAENHENKTFIVTLTENRRLTPLNYDRNVFHLEMDTTGTGLEYGIGDALGVHGHNAIEETLEFLDFYKLNPDSIISVKKELDSEQGENRTMLQLFTQHLDIFGRPSKRFYEALATFAKDPSEKERLEFLISSEGATEFKQRVNDTITYADILKEFTSAHPDIDDLVQLVPPIKPRHYSIASSMKMHPNSVHLLVVLVDWTTSTGEERIGQCTRYLSQMKVGDQLTVSIKPSVMKLPPRDEQPVIMAGLGTGMAPFRAFVQERAYLKAQGKQVGPMALYFGSRFRSSEYLYGEELEAYHAEGLLTHLQLAFSRDQKQKIYIQHKMQEDSQLLHQYMLQEDGHFYLCGPTWPAGDVKDAMVSSFVENGGITESQANNKISELKELEKYILEVY